MLLSIHYYAHTHRLQWAMTQSFWLKSVHTILRHSQDLVDSLSWYLALYLQQIKSFHSINWDAVWPLALYVTWTRRMKALVSKNTSRCNCVIVGRHRDQGNKCFRFPVWLQSRLHSRGLYQYLYKEFQPNPVGDPLLWVSAFHWWTMMTLDNRTKAVHWPGWTPATLLHTVQHWLKSGVKIGYIHMFMFFTQKPIHNCLYLIKNK